MSLSQTFPKQTKKNIARANQAWEINLQPEITAMNRAEDSLAQLELITNLNFHILKI